MNMNEFAEVIKKSEIAGGNKRKIIFRLLQAIGTEDAVSQVSKGVLNGTTEPSPTDSTIQKWLSGSRPRSVIYFPQLKVEDSKEAHKFLMKTLKKDQWTQLRDLFKEWHNNNQNADAAFYINTETDDFITFSTSFWKQFISYFESVRLWDDAEEQHSKTDGNRNKVKSSIADEMIGVFKEKFTQYKIYEFIPKDIEMITCSLYINREILDENVMHKEAVSDCDTLPRLKKMYCKCSLDYNYFLFYAVACRNNFWEMKMPKECMCLKFPESFDYNVMPANMWLSASFKYAIVDTSIPADAQVHDETLQWNECQGNIIIVEIDLPADKDYSIVEDCHVLIDGMLLQNSLADKFAADINEKIIEKYKGITFDDHSRLIYNTIKQYRKTLKKFKKYLISFENLRKEKDASLCNQKIMKQFGMYTSFSDFESSPKPTFPFSECYLKPEEARKIESGLCDCHESLMELYAGIINYGKK